MAVTASSASRSCYSAIPDARDDDCDLEYLPVELLVEVEVPDPLERLAGETEKQAEEEEVGVATSSSGSNYKTNTAISSSGVGSSTAVLTL